MRIGTPVNQVRLTNVAYVRLNKNGKRFEIAAYRNKVLSYRNKVETDLSQVLQIDTVFTNVTKGLLANSKDLIEAFGTSDQILVCKEILDKGELQVSEQERVALLDSTFRDVASIVADKAINPENNRPYTVSMIQNAMRQIHYSVNVSKSSKSQALDVIRKLKAIMPIARASMLLRVVCPSKYFESMKDILLKEFNVSIITQGIQGQSNAATTTTTTDDDNTNVKENDNSSNNVFMEFKFDTELFRKLEETVQQHTRNEGILEVLQLRTSSGPSDNNTSNTTNNTTTTTDDNPIDTEIPLQQIEKKAKDVISKSELKKIEKNNDFKVNANSDDDDDDDDEEETVFGIVKKNKKIKKNKNKNDIDKNDTVEKHNHRDNEDEDGDDDDDKGDGKGTQKKSKKAKRLEKEEKKEREVKESKLKQRMENEKAKREATISTTTTTTTTTTTDTGTSAEVDKPAATAATVTTTATAATTIAATTTTTTSSSKCNTCGGSFPDAASYRAHFKSEWHRYNLNRKMKSLPIVSSEEAFAKLSFDEINAASISTGHNNG